MNSYLSFATFVGVLAMAQKSVAHIHKPLTRRSTSLVNG